MFEQTFHALRFVAAMIVVFVFAFAARAAEVPPDYRYKIEVLATGMPQPLLLQLAPDGRIFFNELRGVLKIRKPGGEVVEAGTISVFAEQENGLLGFALDPQFAKNEWIYLLYSPTNFVGQRLSRFRMNGDRLDMASEKEILRFDEQRRECCHHAGSVRFAPDGCLLISTGDNTHPFGDSAKLRPDGRATRPRAVGRATQCREHGVEERQDSSHPAHARGQLHDSGRKSFSEGRLGRLPGNFCDGLPQSVAHDRG